MSNKFLLFGVMALLLSALGSAQVFYESEASIDYEKTNITIQLSCDSSEDNCPVNSWNLEWNLPNEAQIEKLNSSRGEIEDYEFERGVLSITTNVQTPTENETVFIQYQNDQSAEPVHEKFYTREIDLPGFNSETNSGNITAKNLLSGQVSGTSSYNIREDSMKFSTEGSSNLILNLLDEDKEYFETDYFVFANSEVEESDLAYEAPIGILEKQPKANKMPVIFIDSSTYDSEYGEWSQARYSQDMIIMREDLDERELPVLAHEVVHAINSHVLSWDRTGTSYLDEGMATYVEYLIQRKMSEKPVYEVFGDEITYEERREGQRYEVTQYPRGDKDELWEYYQQESNAMKDWNGDNNREFGYSYGQLIVMNHVSRNDGELSDITSDLNQIEGSIENNSEKWEKLGEFVDLEPCNYEDREDFNNCLEEINDHNYTIQRAEPIEDSEEFQIDRIELEKFEPESEQENIQEEIQAETQNIILWLQQAFNRFLSAFR